MWNCNWGNPYTYSGWFSSHSMFGWLINILIMFTIMYIIFRIIIAVIPGKQTHYDPMEKLKIKLAQGDITEDEYQRIKNILVP